MKINFVDLQLDKQHTFEFKPTGNNHPTPRNDFQMGSIRFEYTDSNFLNGCKYIDMPIICRISRTKFEIQGLYTDHPVIYVSIVFFGQANALRVLLYRIIWYIENQLCIYNINYPNLKDEIYADRFICRYLGREALIKDLKRKALYMSLCYKWEELKNINYRLSLLGYNVESNYQPVSV